MDNPFLSLLPERLAAHVRSDYPVEVTIDGEPVPLRASATGATGRSGSLNVDLEFDSLADGSIVWSIALANVGDRAVEHISVTPLTVRLDLDPAVRLPMVRHLSGSWHYDANYPPRAFRINEEAFLTHDFTQRVTIGGPNAGFHSPILQFATQDDAGLCGFFVGFEWSAGWRLSGGWSEDSFDGEERSDFLIEGSIELGELRIQPGQMLQLPRTHLGVFTGESWNDLDNIQRRYLRAISPAAPAIDRHPVSYDHWFGLYDGFTVEDLLAQATRAAEIGCEAFCLDACWYKSDNVSNGIGNWTEPDPQRFPNGDSDVRRLSDHVRSLGMRFGLWHIIQLAKPGTRSATEASSLYRPMAERDSYERGMREFGGIEQIDNPDYGQFTGLHLKLEEPEGVRYALDLMRSWITRWNVEWFRFEAIPEDGLAYNQGFDVLVATIRDEFPNVYIEACNGGGQRLDINSVVSTHGNWLSDHTSNADITRFNQAGALRFWPSHMLNMAVVAFRGRGDDGTDPVHVLSRMLGVLSFNGDIAQWSAAATARVSSIVGSYKAIRHLLDGDVYFPLPQPRSVRDWDAVLYRDASSGSVALFVFRTSGDDTVRLEFDFPLPAHDLVLLAGSEGARLAPEGQGMRISLPAGSAALWTSSVS